MKLINRQKLYGLLSVAAGGALLLGISQQFNQSAPPKTPDISDFVEVETLTNSNGKNVLAAVLHREDYEFFQSAYLTAYSNRQFVDFSEVTKQLSSLFKKQGLTPDQAESVAVNMIDTYETAIYLSLDESETPFDGLQPQALRARGEDFAIYACSIVGVSRQHDGVDWVRGFLESPNAKINLPRDYTREFYAFILNHERAHCMGASEGQADAAAARLLLKHHPDKNRAREFLILFNDLRVYRSFMNAAENKGLSYGVTAPALMHVLDEHEKEERIALTDAEIWTLADQEKYESTHAYLTIVYDLCNSVISDLQEHRFANAAARVRTIADSGYSEVIGTQLDRIAQSFDRLAQITPPLLPPAAPHGKVNAKSNVKTNS